MMGTRPGTGVVSGPLRSMGSRLPLALLVALAVSTSTLSEAPLQPGFGLRGREHRASVGDVRRTGLAGIHALPSGMLGRAREMVLWGGFLRGGNDSRDEIEWRRGGSEGGRDGSGEGGEEQEEREEGEGGEEDVDKEGRGGISGSGEEEEGSDDLPGGGEVARAMAGEVHGGAWNVDEDDERYGEEWDTLMRETLREVEEDMDAEGPEAGEEQGWHDLQVFALASSQRLQRGMHAHDCLPFPPPRPHSRR